MQCPMNPGRYSRQWLGHVGNGGDDFRKSGADYCFDVAANGYTDLDSRVHMFVNAYSISPGMTVRSMTSHL